METKTQIESQINFIIWVMMVDLGSSSREGELQGGEGKREEQARCWTFTFTFFLFFQKTFTFPTRTKLTTYILTYPTRQRFHLSTVVSEDGLRAELLFDLDAREEWETSAACKQKSRKPQFGWMQPTTCFPNCSEWITCMASMSTTLVALYRRRTSTTLLHKQRYVGYFR